jgi:hypothetical protein
VTRVAHDLLGEHAGAIRGRHNASTQARGADRLGKRTLDAYGGRTAPQDLAGRGCPRLCSRRPRGREAERPLPRYPLPHNPIMKGEGVLRPEVQIEVGAFPARREPVILPVTPSCAEAAKRGLKVEGIPCVALVVRRCPSCEGRPQDQRSERCGRGCSGGRARGSDYRARLGRVRHADDPLGRCHTGLAPPGTDRSRQTEMIGCRQGAGRGGRQICRLSRLRRPPCRPNGQATPLRASSTEGT